MKQVLEKSLLNKVERLDAFEEKFGIRFENISIKVQESIDNSEEYVELFFEAHSTNGTTIDDTITIQIILYDKQNSIINSNYNYLLEDSFFGFEIVHFLFSDINLIDRINKIRIYPKKG